MEPIGPDGGSMRHSVSLAAGESPEYPFRLSVPGEMRVKVEYLIGQKTVPAGTYRCPSPASRQASSESPARATVTFTGIPSSENTLWDYFQIVRAR